MILLVSGLRYTGTTTAAQYLRELGFNVISLEDESRLESYKGVRLLDSLDVKREIVDDPSPWVKRIVGSVNTESGDIVEGYMNGCLDFHSQLPKSTLIKIIASSHDRWSRYKKLEEERRRSKIDRFRRVEEDKPLSFSDFVSLYGRENPDLFSPGDSRVIIQNDRGLKELYRKVLDLQSCLTNGRFRLVI